MLRDAEYETATEAEIEQNKGQNPDEWSAQWGRLSPESEIRMWDFFGLRPYILKYAPRSGKIIEAGCGLGRYVFYLEKLGLDVEGVDFDGEVIGRLNDWKRQNGFSSNFRTGNVLEMPYEDDSLAGYISLGVIEHFIEGPGQALKEAYRILRPGGVAIITTPSVSFSISYIRLMKRLKSLVKKMLRMPKQEEEFFQYWFRPAKLRRFVENAGFDIALNLGADLMYSLYELGFRPRSENRLTSLVSNLESTKCAQTGAQSLVVALKKADLMHCFLCGELNVTAQEMKTSVPICGKCLEREESGNFSKAERMPFLRDFQINPPVSANHLICDFCEASYKEHPIFENFGFSKNACEGCLENPRVHFDLIENHVQPIWRSRHI